MPDDAHCAPVAQWDPLWTQYEEEVLLHTNEWRARGANCDTRGAFEAAPPLTMEPHLRCSSRLHSQDMSARGFFAHDNPDGQSPTARMNAAGYSGVITGENIATGQRSPREVVDGWIDSDGHCANIMNPVYTEIGVGYVEGGGANPFVLPTFWTQNFGARCPPELALFCGGP